MHFAAQPATPAQRRVVLALCALLLLGCLALLPVAAMPLAPMPHVSGLFGTATASIDLATFLLLRADAQPRRAHRLLAAGYLWAGLMALVHVLVFPGALLPDRPVFGDRESVTWLFNAWHAGFPLWVIAAATAELRGRTRQLRPSPELLAVLLFGAALAVCLLPASAFQPGSFVSAFSQPGASISFGCAGLSLAALALLQFSALRRRVLWLWMSFVLAADAAGMVASTAGGGRYTLAWYGTRVEGVLASIVVLVLLSTHFRTIQATLVATVDDLRRRTDALQAEIQRRERAERMLVQAQKLEAVGQLAAGLAHDFNNLMQVIVARLEILRRRAGAHVDEDVAVVRRSIRKAEGLTRQLMLFTGRRQAQPRTTRLQRLLPDLVGMLLPLVRSDIAIELDAPDDVPPVHVDIEEFETALTNLVANARDAMPRGGMIRVSLSAAAPGAGAPAWVELRVRDDGSGMAAEVMERVFEPFFTTKEPGKGTGLGLSQVHAFARSSGGSAAIDSAPGRGTTVTLRLPAVAADAGADAARGGEPTVPRPVRGRLILLVDDSEDVRESTALLLEHAGHVVKCAGSAGEALALLSGGYAPDALVSDIVMPGDLDGFGLAREVARRWPAMRIVLATGYSVAADQAREDGLTVLQKPYASLDLMRALDTA